MIAKRKTNDDPVSPTTRQGHVKAVSGIKNEYHFPRREIQA